MASEAPQGVRRSPRTHAPRPIRPADLPEVLAIERDAFPVPWTERAFRHLMDRDDAGVLVVDAPGGGVGGYAAYWVASDEAELADLAVHPEHRRRGVGRRLVEAVCREARRRGARTVFLQVRESNRAALGLYREAGFVEQGRRRRYYRRPSEDAIVLARRAGARAD